MSRYSAFEHSHWGNHLVVNRSLDNWREYGAAIALFELKGAWNGFLFSRDARQIALITRTISEKADQEFNFFLRDGLRLSGGEMWKRYKGEVGISPREMSVWKKAFIEAYSEQLEENLSGIIPTELDGKLEVFCSTVGAIARHLQSGGDADDFGVSLGRKVQELTKTHPKKAEILSRAKREATEEAERQWLWQTTGDTSIQCHYANAPFDWELDRYEEALYEKTYAEAYFSTMRDHLENFLPKKIWKNAFLICSLYDEMQAQKDRKKKYDSQKGWTYLRSQREHDLWLSDQRREEARKVYETNTTPRPPAPTMGISNLQAQFGSPQVSMTPGAKAAFEQSGEQPAKYLDRHFSGDFGEVTGDDAALNQGNIASTGMVMSIYTLSTGVRFYIITDDGHLITTLLLPSEY